MSPTRQERIRLTALYSNVRDTIENALHDGMAEDDAHLAVHAAIAAYYENSAPASVPSASTDSRKEGT